MSIGLTVQPAEAELRSPSTGVAASAVYVVQTGDYLMGIATKLKVRLTDLLTVNSLSLASVIHAGDELEVPAGGTLPTVPIAVASTPTPASGASNLMYTVKAGDYLIDIAARNGATLKALLVANNLIASSTIVPGQKLTLPPATLPLPTAPTPTPPAASTLTNPVPAAAPTAPAQDPAQDPMATMVDFLMAQIGKPYAFNTAGPDTYDCSGLVTAAYLRIGISLPHQSLLQSRLGTAVDWRTDDIQAGDLVFSFSTGKTYISHVGIAISSTQWIQASGSSVPVKIGPLPNADKIQTVRRIVNG